MRLKIFSLILCLTFIFSINIFANENKPIKIYNRDVTLSTINIEDKIYLNLNELNYYSKDPFTMTYNPSTQLYYGYFDEKYISLSLDGNIIHSGNGYIYSNNKPLMIEDNIYVTLDVVTYILGCEYKETNDFILIDDYSKGRDYSFTENNMIAHALGGVDNIAVTNSLEAFLYNYERGYKVFEVDLQYTQDEKLVAAHDLSSPYKNSNLSFLKDGVTYEEFRNNKIYETLTPLSFEDVVYLMEQYPDVYIITDTKYTDTETIEKQFNTMIETTEKIDKSLLDRMIPQLYTYEMYDTINEIYNFNSYIFTLYQMEDLDVSYFTNFVYENGIGAVTMDEYRATSSSIIHSLNQYGIKSYVHTINDLNVVVNYLNMGVNGFYTDFLPNYNFDFISVNEAM